MTARASRWTRCSALASLGIGAFGVAALGLGTSGTLLHAQTPPAAATAPTQPAEPPLQWHDVSQWGVEGRAWPDLERKRWYDRFPSQAEATVTPAVWGLSRHSAGMLVRFKTNADAIWANYTLFSDRLSQPNMTAIAMSGLDLYARDDAGKWRWVGVTRPAAKVVRQSIIARLAPGTREYAIYLPLYNGIDSLSIGVPPGSTFERLAPRTEKPIVFYGTSITHGASASRPGMTHVAILGRRFDKPVVNLGFSGNGRMDAAVGDLLVKIDAAVYVIDCLPNMDAAAVTLKCVPLVKQIRAARPTTPIVLVEDRRQTNSWILPALTTFHTDNHAALRACLDALKKDGITGLSYLDGDDLLGDDAEAATDGSHPSDLGMVRQADRFEPVLRKALAGNTTAPSPDARAAAIAVADSALAAITRGDVMALTDLMVPEGVMFPTSTRDGLTTYRVRTREAQRRAPMNGIIERGFAPQAMVNGGVAMVWYPYDLYVNGAWSHCGVDVFTLVKSSGAWRIASLAWSAEQPPTCEKHPSGPPRR